MEDLYAELGLTRTATAEEIKKAYRRLAFEYHPDRNQGNAAAEEKFKRINAAYDVLGDETKRRQYDTYGSTGQATSSNPYGNYGTWTGNDPFEQWFGQGRSRQYYGYQRYNQQETEENPYAQWYSFYRRKEPNEKKTVSESIVSIAGNLLLFLLSLNFLRYSIFLLPLGPILCIAGMIKGAKGVAAGFASLFQPKKN